MAEANVRLKVDGRDAVNQLNRVNKEAKKLNTSFEQTKRKTATATANVQRFGIAFRSVVGPVVALTGAVAFLNKSLGVFAERQADANLLAAGLQKIGAATGDLKKLQKVASDLGDQTLFNQEDFTQGFALLTSFRAIGQDSFERVATAAADMAATTKQDVNSSLLQLAKALENPVEGMSALSRSGTTFTQVQKDIVKGLVKSNKTFEAQSYILGLVEEQYKGNARAAAVGLAGAQDTLSESIRDFNEVVGQIALEPAIAATNTLTGLFKQATSELTEWNKAFGKLSQLLAPVTGGLDLVGQSIQNTTELLKLGIPGLSATLQMYEKIITLRGLLNAQGELPGTSQDLRPGQGAALDPAAIARFQRQLQLEDMFKAGPKVSGGSGTGRATQRVDMSDPMLALQKERLELLLQEDRLGLAIKENQIELLRISESSVDPNQRIFEILRANSTLAVKQKGIDKEQLDRFNELKAAAESLGTTVAEDFIKRAAAETDLLKDALQGVGDILGNQMMNVFDGLINKTLDFNDVLRSTLAQVGKLLMTAGLNSLAGSDGVGILSFLGFGTKANGGSVSGGQPYMVGERGPELFVPGQSGGVMRNEDMRSLMGRSPASGSAPSMNFSFETTSIGGTEYVSREQLEQAMAVTRKQASNDGAKRGMSMTLDKMQNSPRTRTRIGLR